MTREEANILCAKAGVAAVPAGVNPQDWLDDNDVFDTDSGVDGQALVVADVYKERVAQATSDHERINEILAKLKVDGFVHTTAIGYVLEWSPLASGLWGAMSGAPNDLSAGYYTHDYIRDKPVAVRHTYGNACAYYVLPNILGHCLDAWWTDQLQTGYYAERGDPVAGVRWAAKHTIELADKYADCLGGDDAVRFVAKAGREKLERLAAL